MMQVRLEIPFDEKSSKKTTKSTKKPQPSTTKTAQEKDVPFKPKLTNSKKNPVRSIGEKLYRCQRNQFFENALMGMYRGKPLSGMNSCVFNSHLNLFLRLLKKGFHPEIVLEILQQSPEVQEIIDVIAENKFLIPLEANLKRCSLIATCVKNRSLKSYKETKNSVRVDASSSHNQVTKELQIAGGYYVQWCTEHPLDFDYSLCHSFSLTEFNHIKRYGTVPPPQTCGQCQREACKGTLWWVKRPLNRSFRIHLENQRIPVHAGNQEQLFPEIVSVGKKRFRRTGVFGDTSLIQGDSHSQLIFFSKKCNEVICDSLPTKISKLSAGYLCFASEVVYIID